MQISQSAKTQAAYWTRGATSVGDYFNASGVAPSSEYTALQYTVPSGRACFLSSLTSTITRASAATTVGDWGYEVYMQNDLSNQPDLYSDRSYDNTVNTVVNTLFQNNVVMLSGNILYMTFYDLSSGGTTDQLASYTGVEFNA